MAARAPTTKKSVRTRASDSPPPLPQNPLWFKDAVIYQIHIRAFCDSTADGIGDFRGLTEKLDYIHDLGVTAIWLLPFFPSPLKDDGYDTADYYGVNSNYGSLRDFRAFLREAKNRNLRVITEMVMNHTSDQHEWFQKSRRAKPGDPWRDFYVWSDNSDRYRDARIIFQDFETSNWTWDPIAQAFYWHRFYHHQPDLNFDNPEVRKAMLDAVEFWLEMGVDGLRLDAVPYLYERDGTNCENLEETHAFLRELRRHVDERFSDKLLLAEANQWPEDAAAYFGDGNECHMNFHFPLMPRLFMAVEREDRFPIIDILDQTPQIPAGCQWGIFLRNHDELTLEMVTDEERDYMYRAYADDPQARVNLGIRRRLAPLLRNNRRKIELMNALLLSLPGTPIIYYGDELGMGDNIYLGDRDGVRTPMQWNGDRNAGFSRANPQSLYLPPIIDAEYHYEVINVEVQQNSPHSLLWWMRRIIGARKQLQAFGHGTMEFITPDNPKILAYVRQHERETILVVANLSRFVQCAELDLSRFRGQTPVELFGQTRFPPIGELPYFLTLGPHAFYWFRLEWPAAEVSSLGLDLPSCTISGKWDSLFTGAARGKLERALPAYLQRQRWFGGKSRVLQSSEVTDVIPIPGPPDRAPLRILILRVSFTEGEPDVYVLPVIFARGDQAANITGDHPRAGILRVERSDQEQPAILCEAIWEQELWLSLYDAISREKTLAGQRGEISAEHTSFFRSQSANGRSRQSDGMAAPPSDSQDADDSPRGVPAPASRQPSVSIYGGEQRNVSVFLDNRYVLKVYRRLGAGENPDLEIGRFLTDRGELSCVPRLAGSLVYHPGEGTRPARSRSEGEPMTLGVVHEYVRNEGDSWSSTLDELGRSVERIESAPGSAPPRVPGLNAASLLSMAEQTPPLAAMALIGPSLQAADLLGRRTAELHVSLAQGVTPAFAPEPFTRLYQRSLYQSMRTHSRQMFHLMRKRLTRLPEDVRPVAEKLAGRESELLQRFEILIDRPIQAMRIRCHGDYHLGQVLFTGKDFAIIDFEGEPNRPISERRIKRSPLRDVAGMIRSFHYASHSVQKGEAPGALVQPAIADIQGWMRNWYAWTSAVFLKAYLPHARAAGIVPQDGEELRILLDAFLLEKAIHELGHELNDRPDWVAIPLEGILHQLDA